MNERKRMIIRAKNTDDYQCRHIGRKSGWYRRLNGAVDKLMVKDFNLACEIEQWQQKFAH